MSYVASQSQSPKIITPFIPNIYPHHHIMSSTNGDYIGTESCINDVIHNDFDDMINDPSALVIDKQTYSGKKPEKREFPPPIPLLARTQNLPSHMPWELKRYYTSDGRLILREEKVRHHHYFRAHRSNGRLTLQLVPFYHMLHFNSLSLSAHHDTRVVDVEEEPAYPPQTDEDDEIDNNTSVEDGRANNRYRDEAPNTVASNCNFKFNRVSSAPSCLFEMPMRPIRTGHG